MTREEFKKWLDEKFAELEKLLYTEDSKTDEKDKDNKTDKNN